MTTPWSWLPGSPFETKTKTTTPTSPTWHRKFWGAEALFARTALAFPGRSDVMVASILDAPPSARPTLAHIRAALRALRFAHPSIASTVAWAPDKSEGCFVYAAPPDERAVDAWLDAVVLPVPAPSGTGVQEMLTRLADDLGKVDAVRTSDLLKLYYIGAGEREQGVMLCLQHTLFDGLASCQALGCFLQELSKILGRSAQDLSPTACPLPWGTEGARLARPVPDRIQNQWSPADLHDDWPIVQRMRTVLARPNTNFGIPIIPDPSVAPTHCAFTLHALPPGTAQQLMRAARAHGCKMFAVQFAATVIACMRLGAPLALPAAGEHRITMAYNPYNLRPRLATLGGLEGVELVGATGFNTLDAADLGRFAHCAGGGDRDRATLDAVWTLAREVQAQLGEQEAWQADAARFAPVVMRALAEFLYKSPPPLHPLYTPQLTNLGALDSIIHHSYPIHSASKHPSALTLTIKHFELHNVIFHLPRPAMVCAYTWRGVLWYSHAASAAHVAAAPMAQFVRELERITVLAAADVDTMGGGDVGAVGRGQAGPVTVGARAKM